MDILIDVLDFVLDLFGEPVARFFDKRIKSRKIKSVISLISLLITVACVVGIIVLVVMDFCK